MFNYRHFENPAKSWIRTLIQDTKGHCPTVQETPFPISNIACVKQWDCTVYWEEGGEVQGLINGKKMDLGKQSCFCFLFFVEAQGITRNHFLKDLLT